MIKLNGAGQHVEITVSDLL